MSKSRRKTDPTTSFSVGCDDGQCSINNATTTAATPIALSDTLQNGALATLATTAAQEILTDLLSSRLHEDLLYCTNQLVRAAILCGYFNIGMYRVAATPILQNYFYQYTKYAMRDEASAEAAANVMTICSILGYDIAYGVFYADTSFTEAALTGVATITANLATKSGTRAVYQWIKSGLFGASQAESRPKEEPRKQAWISLGF